MYANVDKKLLAIGIYIGYHLKRVAGSSLLVDANNIITKNSTKYGGVGLVSFQLKCTEPPTNEINQTLTRHSTQNDCQAEGPNKLPTRTLFTR